MKELRRAVLFAVSIMASPAAAGPRLVRIPVTVTSAAQEQMAKRLSSALVRELKRDPRFMLAVQPSPQLLNISLLTGIGWKRRLDWTEIQYRARLNSPSGHSIVIAGQCWNWSLAACAKQILDAAARLAPWRHERKSTF